MKKRILSIVLAVAMIISNNSISIAADSHNGESVAVATSQTDVSDDIKKEKEI